MSPTLPSPRQAVLAAGIVLAIAGFGLAGFGLWQWMQPPRSVSGVVQDDCNLNRAPCRAQFASGTLTVSVTPNPIPVTAPVTVEVQLSGIAADSVEIDLKSPDMYMGYNRHTLAPKGDGRFVGRTVLPVCVRDRMRWRMQVTARSRHGDLGAGFAFETAGAADRRG